MAKWTLLLLSVIAPAAFAQFPQKMTKGDTTANISTYRVERDGQAMRYGISVCVSTTDERVAAFNIYVMVRDADGYTYEHMGDAGINKDRLACRNFEMGAVPPAKVREFWVVRTYAPGPMEYLVEPSK